jgi:inorganic pyrophosphatase
MLTNDENNHPALIDWENIVKKYEKEMFSKLQGLPDHRDIPEKLRDFRNIISHELPESSSKKLYNGLIKQLLKNKLIDVDGARKKYLKPELEKEQRFLANNKEKFEKIKKDSESWIKENLSEEILQKMWKAHKTWLPRRYTVYNKPHTPFQIVAADTLARYYLINKYSEAKYYLGKEVEVIIDRPLGSKHPKHDFLYEANYGYIPDTKSPDGEELDAYYLGVDKRSLASEAGKPLKRAKGICIAIIHRTNDNDDKLVVVPKGIKLSNKDIEKQIEFQEKWFKYEIIR